ncbi:MAG: bifunctional DNA primase/polymerase, partial [Xanthobacteraceae bacterium]
MNSLRTAVRAACRAYKKSGRMLDAALAYAEHSFPIFPLDPVSKAPIPRRDKDPTGAYPDGIPRTGGHYKATCDADVIRRWWRRTPNALIGMPMGERTGVFTIDVDTPEDHADGVSAWQALAAEHPEFTTREHRSATGGPHLIFLWVEGIRCATGELPGGVEVKGQGGYIAVPPSQRKGRSYTVFRDIDPEPAPKWLLDLILAKQSPAQFSSGEIVDQTELADAMRAIPNDDLDWTDWNNFGMAIWAATGGKGFEIFDEWSAKSPWYGVKETPAERWKAITGSPPNQTGSGKIFKAAGKHGWMPKAATYQLPTYSDLTQARQRLKALTRDFLQQVAIWAEATDTDDATDTAPPPVWAARVGTGIGKTRIAIEELAAWIRANAGTLRGPVVYLVPRHKLGDEILQLFAAQGIDARIFRGRDAENPEQPGWKMCLNPG